MEKERFLFYASWLITIEQTPPEETHHFLMNIKRFFEGKDPILNTPIDNVLWSIAKDNLEKDHQSWLHICEVNRKNGGNGGRPKKTHSVKDKPIETHSVIVASEPKRKKPDSDGDSDSDYDSGGDASTGKKVVKRKAPHNTTYPQPFLDFLTRYGLSVNDSKVKYIFQEFSKLDNNLQTWAIRNIPAYFVYCEENPEHKRKTAEQYLKYEVYKWENVVDIEDKLYSRNFDW